MIATMLNKLHNIHTYRRTHTYTRIYVYILGGLVAVRTITQVEKYAEDDKLKDTP